MQASNIQYHLEMFSAIAEANDGNRAAGLPGYGASVDYIRETLEGTGYEVTLQSFPFTAFYPVAEGELQQLSPTMEDYVWDEQFTYLSHTDAGDVSGTVVAVDIEPGQATHPPVAVRRRILLNSRLVPLPWYRGAAAPLEQRLPMRPMPAPSAC